ncbi:hypothetical protein [Bosea massiliensis]|uniref:Uncharacterized protein n=1 Tax=Bosea massiliensis TaxID=151419 RepID=A0ABW0P8V7_9HYPH
MMNLDLDDDGRDYDEMWFGHASQLMSVRGLPSVRAAASSLALMRRVFGRDPAFNAWLAAVLASLPPSPALKPQGQAKP